MRSVQMQETELTQAEVEDSEPLVCYERSLYHYLRRNKGISSFYWLYADRHNHLQHVPMQNEALQFHYDGLTSLLDRIEDERWIPRAFFVETLREMLEQGYQARAMLWTPRPDGSTYRTSSLIEGADKAGFFLTKTNEVMRRTRVHSPFDEVVGRCSFTPEGETLVGFLRMDYELEEGLRSREGMRLFSYIVKNLYGYTVEDGSLHRNSGPARYDRSACRDLLHSVEEEREKLLEIRSDKALQLRLNKHIGNKLVPLWRAWYKITADPSIALLIPPGAIDELETNRLLCADRLRRLQKWFTVMVGRQNRSSTSSYINALEALTEAHERWTKTADRTFIEAICACDKVEA